jgi:hypothetical protein
MQSSQQPIPPRTQTTKGRGMSQNPQKKSQWHKRRYKQNKAYSLEQKAIRGECEECFLPFDLSNSSNFHWAHTNREDKVGHVSLLVGRSFLTLEKEIKKCRLLCYECHWKETLANKDHGYRRGIEQRIDRNPDQLELDL